jgi:hypothetical protein
MACCDRRRNFASHLDREVQPAAILADLQSNRAGYGAGAELERGK